MDIHAPVRVRPISSGHHAEWATAMPTTKIPELGPRVDPHQSQCRRNITASRPKDERPDVSRFAASLGHGRWV